MHSVESDGHVSLWMEERILYSFWRDGGYPFFLINKWIYGKYDEDVKGFPNGAFYIDWGSPFLEMVDPSFYGKK